MFPSLRTFRKKNCLSSTKRVSLLDKCNSLYVIQKSVLVDTLRPQLEINHEYDSQSSWSYLFLCSPYCVLHGLLAYVNKNSVIVCTQRGWLFGLLSEINSRRETGPMYKRGLSAFEERREPQKPSSSTRPALLLLSFHRRKLLRVLKLSGAAQ